MGFFRVVFFYIVPAAVNVYALALFHGDADQFTKDHVLGRVPTDIESLLIHRGIMGFFFVDLLALMTGMFCKDHRFKVTTCLIRLVASGLSWHVGPVSLLKLARATEGMDDSVVKTGLMVVGLTLFANVISLLFEMTNEPKTKGGSPDAFRALMAEASQLNMSRGAAGAGAGAQAGKSPGKGKSPGSAGKGGKKSK